ncbi:calmodulin-like [Teleopsis dalmanni]|uniref:calmodulin-like n=1 Tax=Teleopsis dalmanni TaxID=139649 RepID=UPI0018CD1154|nr:calmodulin-like [Teleopsis dalmanni]
MADNLNEESVAYLRQMFEVADTDQDGYISSEEFMNIARLVCQGANQAITDAEIQALINEPGSDDGDKIDFSKFAKLIAPKMFTDDCSKEDLGEVFRCIDSDHDGLITAEQLKKVITDSGESCTDEEIADLMRMVDVDGDGRINLTEFIAIWNLRVE